MAQLCRAASAADTLAYDGGLGDGRVRGRRRSAVPAPAVMRPVETTLESGKPPRPPAATMFHGARRPGDQTRDRASAAAADAAAPGNRQPLEPSPSTP